MFGGMRGGFLQGKSRGNLGALRDSRSTQSAPQGLGNAPSDWGEPTNPSVFMRQPMAASPWGETTAAKTAAADIPASSPSPWGTPSQLPSLIDTAVTNEDMVSTVTPDDVTMHESSSNTDYRKQQQLPPTPATGNAAVDGATAAHTTSTTTAIPPTTILRTSFTPLYPHMTSTVPKSALHALYGRAPRRCSLAADLYHTWHDSGPPHTLM